MKEEEVLGWYTDIQKVMKSFFLVSPCFSNVREMAVKFNDYFEFPREFDIFPYTAVGLAKMEGTEFQSSTEILLH